MAIFGKSSDEKDPGKQIQLYEKQIQRLEKLMELTQKIHSTLQLDLALGIVLDAAIELAQMQRGFIMLFSADGELEYRTGRDHTGRTLLKEEFQASTTVIQKAVDQQDLFYFINPSQVGSQSVINLQIGSGFCVPLFAYRSISEAGGAKKMVGILYEDSKRISRFGKEEEDLVKGLAVQAGLALENATLYELATLDGLTRIYQRRYLEAIAELEWKRAVRYKHPLSLLLLDLDHFKKVNDTYGHDKGDVVLRKAANILRNACRVEDFVGRFGGEEFIVLLPETDLDGVKPVAQRIQDSFRSTKMLDDFIVTVSVGAAIHPACRAESVQQLIKFADQALYYAKNHGRNQTVIYVPNQK
jgi:diguanylate cyclase (GGDEF)-like protein